MPRLRDPCHPFGRARQLREVSSSIREMGPEIYQGLIFNYRHNSWAWRKIRLEKHCCILGPPCRKFGWNDHRNFQNFVPKFQRRSSPPRQASCVPECPGNHCQPKLGAPTSTRTMGVLWCIDDSNVNECLRTSRKSVGDRRPDVPDTTRTNPDLQDKLSHQPNYDRSNHFCILM